MSITKYVKISDPSIAAPSPPATIKVALASPKEGTVAVSKLKTVRKGDADYDNAVEWWMYVNGYMPKTSITLKVKSSI